MAKKPKRLIRNSFLCTCALAGATLMPRVSAEAESYRYQIRPASYRNDNRYYVPQRATQRAAQALAQDANSFYRSLVQLSRSRHVSQSTRRAANRFTDASADLARDLRHSNFGRNAYDNRLRRLENRYEDLERKFSRERHVTQNIYRKWRRIGNSYRQLYNNRYVTSVSYPANYNSNTVYNYNREDNRYRPRNRNDCYDDYYYNKKRIKNRLRR